MTRRTVLVTISDTHGGCKIALMNPDTLLWAINADGKVVPYHPEVTETQYYLWDIYMDGIKKAIEIADGDEILLTHLGDECQGIKYPQVLVSTRLADQIVIADYNMRPWFEHPNVKTVRIEIGTQAHNAGEGTTALALCQVLQARYPGIDINPQYHGLLNFNGVTIDTAHHGPGPGLRNWLKGNVARYYLTDLMQREIIAKRVPPRLILRGHQHVPVYEYKRIEEHESELFILPSFSMMNDHAIQVSQSQFDVTNGMLITEIVDGEIIKHHEIYTRKDTRTKETL